MFRSYAHYERSAQVLVVSLIYSTAVDGSVSGQQGFYENVQMHNLARVFVDRICNEGAVFHTKGQILKLFNTVWQFIFFEIIKIYY